MVWPDNENVTLSAWRKMRIGLFMPVELLLYTEGPTEQGSGPLQSGHLSLSSS